MWKFLYNCTYFTFIGKCIICAVQTLYCKTKSSQIPFYPNRAYKTLEKSADLSKILDGAQQDAHEFFKNLIEAIEKEKKKTKNPDHAPIDFGNFFMAQIHTEVKCLKCRVTYNNKSSVGEFIVNIVGKRSVKQALESFFDGEVVNDYNCVNCMKYVSASKKYTLLSAPKCLCVVLNRIPSKGGKDSRYIETNQELILKCFDGGKLRHFQYKIVSVVNHIGSKYESGHYTTTICYENTIYTLDDSKVFTGSKISNNTTYILFYERAGVITSNSCLHWMLRK